MEVPVLVLLMEVATILTPGAMVLLQTALATYRQATTFAILYNSGFVADINSTK